MRVEGRGKKKREEGGKEKEKRGGKEWRLLLYTVVGRHQVLGGPGRGIGARAHGAAHH